MGAKLLAKLCPLFSGSSGNSYYVSVAGDAILIDAGKSAKQLENMLNINNLKIESIRGIFITHTHHDHVSALRVFASRYKIKVFASESTLLELEKKAIINENIEYYSIDKKTIDVGNIGVDSFETSHDCKGSVAYVINTRDDTKLSVVTDLGIVTDKVRESISGSDVVVIESNHDVAMLRSGSYPYNIKRRILSNEGHLSNDACAAELPKLVEKGAKHILLAHLSKDNNFPDLAKETAVCELNKYCMEENRDYTINVVSAENIYKRNILW